MNQRSIKSAIQISGKGLHTGKIVNLEILPAPANHGIVFKRMDLEGTPKVLADANNVSFTTRNTTIKKGEATVSTIEHLLSALYALGIDNVLVEIDGPEVPIKDGSSIVFVEAIHEVGIEELEAEREVLVITSPIYYKDEETNSEISVLPADGFELTALIDFGSELLGMQYANFNGYSDYAKEVAPSRTFVFLHELTQLIEHDLVKGGGLDNAVVFVERIPEKEELEKIEDSFGEKDVKVESGGTLNKGGLRFENEPARHKLLDMIGDLALVGKAIQGRIVVTKPGHTANVNLAKKLKVLFRKQKKLKGIPKYDPTLSPIYDVVEITKKLPHRFPFLLVDKIIELSEKHVVGVKNVTFNEGFFQGHFPDNPVMPGVLQLEAMAQTGGILALSTVPDPENWDTYFLKIDKAKFKRKVVPGDTVIFKLELLAPIRRGIVCMYGVAYVAENIVSEAELTAQIVRRPV